jgi:nucleotide-binding universal stress UspA family protein
MPQKILAPLDGSSLAEGVLPHILAYTRVNGTEVTLVRVLESPPGAVGQHDPVDWHLRKAEAQAYLERLGESLRPYDLTPHTDVLDGPVANRLIEYAQRNNFDLIALSSHGQSGLSGWTVSSVAQKIITRSRKSILLVPVYQMVGADPSPNLMAYPVRYQRILVPLDGSPRAECVLAKATALARFHEAELMLAYVVTPPHFFQRMPLTESDVTLMERVMERNQQEAERYFEQLRLRFDPPPQTRVVRGEHAPAALQHLVQNEAVDLIILSAHGHIHDDRRPYGQLAANLLTYGAVPIVVFQDLASHEIEPTAAERAYHTSELSAPTRLNPPQLVAA